MTPRPHQANRFRQSARHRASKTSHNGHRSPPNQPIPPVHPPSCEQILTQPRSSHTKPAKPARRNGTVRTNPHKSAFGTIIGKSAHVPTYATRHNTRPTIAGPVKPSPTAPTTHPTTGQRMPRHTRPNTSDKTPDKRHQPSSPVSAGIRNTTHHPSSPCRPAICERILTQWPPHTGKSANPNNSNRRYVSRASHRHRRTPPKPPPTAIRTAIV